MPAPTVTRRRSVFHHARIGRNELDRLIAIASDGAPAGTVKLATIFNSVRLERETLDDLIQERATHPSVSRQTPWVYLSCLRESDDKVVTLAFDRGEVEIDVSAEDTIWTHGQWSRLQEVLLAAQGRYRKLSFHEYIWRQLLPLVALTLILSLDYFKMWGVPVQVREKLGHLPPLFGFLILALWALMASSVSAQWWRFRSSKPVFTVQEEVQWGSIWSRLNTGERIGVTANVVAVLALLVAVAALILGK
jgi:hypothetical protein